MYSVLTGLGYAVPDRVLTNVQLEQMVDTDNEWIVQRTGIRERRIADANTATSDLALAARAFGPGRCRGVRRRS